MDEQSFPRRPPPRRKPAELRVVLRGRELRFRTEAGTFAPGRIDRGTELLIEALEVAPCELILDLGCGSLWLAARTKRGADAIRGRMAEAFGNAGIAKRGSGYKVLRSTKGPREDR